MIPQERVRARTAAYRAKHSLPVFTNWDEVNRQCGRLNTALGYRCEILSHLDNLPFHGIEEAGKEIYLSHNGSIFTGLPVKRLLAAIGMKAPDAIPENYDTGRLARVYRPNEEWLAIGVPSDPFASIKDLYDLCEGSPHARFLEELFGMTSGAFRSRIIQAGFGIRLDRNSHLRRLYDTVLEEKIPFLAHTGVPSYDNPGREEVVVASGIDI